MDVTLYDIERNGSLAQADTPVDGVAADTASSYPAYYEAIGFEKPWIGYLARHDSAWVGACGFKGAPKAGRVEIAYYTFPEFEAQGVATAMARALVFVAQNADPSPIVTARTLPKEGASTAILRKLGFTKTGTVPDPDDGNVWEWVLVES
ncbi:MAG: GNAT family N-acetyltransferase [Candidatus Hydrogenedentes bacterium]|nr:GNAT family N-acetyltransferase [Candidatus Hydrogenedentota bacterium]